MLIHSSILTQEKKKKNHSKLKKWVPVPHENKFQQDFDDVSL